MSTTANITNGLHTQVLDVRDSDHGHFEDANTKESWLVSGSDRPAIKALRETARYMRSSHLPVGFPTETVYGLGADATRSEAVQGIYKAKGRPSDNPLIIHVSDLAMLRDILTPSKTNGHSNQESIPEVYKPLIQRFWPGPLTILLPNPQDSVLAPEVTAGLRTFGVRMPDSPLALSLISLVGHPLAAPSANASTKPSPTSAQHVLHDLNSRIEFILDGGSCQVGLESTVVDGLCEPPVVLRPGGLSIDDIRQVPGWENTMQGYKDESEVGSSAPRAPGMKYKHYSPKAKVILFEREGGKPIDLDATISEILADPSTPSNPRIGIIRTIHWSKYNMGTATDPAAAPEDDDMDISELTKGDNGPTTLLELDLGKDVKAIARRLFSALRALDLRDAHVVIVEGIDDQGDIAAAVMNRLRKAATEIRK